MTTPPDPPNRKFWFHYEGRTILVSERPELSRFLTGKSELREIACLMSEDQQSGWQTPDSFGIQTWIYPPNVCQQCHLHHYARHIKTASRGPDDPDLLCIGQAPGKVEDTNGMAFDPSARAAGLMHEAIEGSGIDLSRVGFTNLGRCCPWQDDVPKYLTDEAYDRGPSDEEIDTCIPYLWEEIHRKRPKLLVLLGNYPLSRLIGGRKKITAARGIVKMCTIPSITLDGVVQPVLEIPCLPMFHPSYAARAGGLQSGPGRLIQDDLQYAKRILYGNEDTQEVDYKHLKTFAEFKQYVEWLIEHADEFKDVGVAVDIENPYFARACDPHGCITAVSISHKSHQAYVYLVDHWAGDLTTSVEYEGFALLMQRFHEIVPINGQNYQHDWFFFQIHCACKRINFHFDTMLGHYYIHNKEIPNDLEFMASKYCNMHGWKSEMATAMGNMPKGYTSYEWLGSEHDPGDRKANFDLFIRYCCSDADSTQRLSILFKHQLIERRQFDGYKQLYIDNFEAIGSLRSNGCKLDEDHLEYLKELYPAKQAEFYEQMMQSEIAQKYRQVNGDYNPNSGDQSGVLFYSPDFMGFPPEKVDAAPSKKHREEPERYPYTFSCAAPVRDNCKLYAADMIALARRDGDEACIQASGLNSAHWQECAQIIEKIDFFRRITKLHGTYVTGIEIGSVHWKGEELQGLASRLRQLTQTVYCVHPQMNLHGAVTGRVSIEDPSFQNIPNPYVSIKMLADLIRLVKMLFVSRWKAEGGLIMEFDLSQIELRVLAMMAREPSMRQVYMDDKDLHRHVAGRINYVLEEEVTKAQRRYAKTTSFGVIYGKGALGLAADLLIPVGDAQGLINDLKHKVFPRVGQFEKEQVAFCEEHGYVYTPFNRIRVLKEIWLDRGHPKRSWAERCALNSPIQGTASDLNLCGMSRAYYRIRDLGLKSRCVNIVHDSSIWDIYPGELMQVARIVWEEQILTPPKIYDWLWGVPLKGDFAFGTSWGATNECGINFETGTIHMKGRMDSFKGFISNLALHPQNYQLVEINEFWDKDQGESIDTKIVIAT